MKKIFLGLLAAISTSTYALNANIVYGHMNGVQKGWVYDYDTILVDLSTSTDKNIEKPTIWWFYNISKKNQSISYDRYYKRQFTQINLDESKADANGNVYVYGKFYYKTGELPTDTKALANLTAVGIEKLVPYGGLVNTIYKDGKLPSGAAPINKVRFDTGSWVKSDKPININSIKAGETQTVTFFKSDIYFDIEK